LKSQGKACNIQNMSQTRKIRKAVIPAAGPSTTLTYSRALRARVARACVRDCASLSTLEAIFL